MIDLGDVSPQATLGPTRTPSGEVVLGRHTITEEQRMEVIAQCTAAITAQPNRGREVRATVHWPGSDPTVLEVGFAAEHIDGKPVFIPEKVTETTLQGATIIPSEAARLRLLQTELDALHDQGMI